MATADPITTTAEQWRPVVGWETRYEVSNLGNVRSLDVDRLDKQGRPWRKKGKMLSPYQNNGGHLYVNLKDSPRKKRGYVHRLVLEAFVGPCPEGMECCHWDDDPTNNNVLNLRWAPRSLNGYDRTRNGRNWNANKTECKRGHAFSPKNTIMSDNGNRRCRECINTAQRENAEKRLELKRRWRAKRRAEGKPVT